jgi:pimeloyl-ACP methyl ester carboxylesterase
MKTRPAIQQSMLQTMGDFDYKAYYEKLNKPTLIIQGSKNPLATNTQIWWENLKRSNGKVKFVTLPKAGIVPALEQPKPFGNAVRAFLRQK